MTGLPVTLVLVATLLSASGCDSEGAPSVSLVKPPCGEEFSKVELGIPRRGSTTAEFTAAGGTIYVTASGFIHGGYFDPAQGRTRIYIGPAEQPPSYDEQRGVVTNSLREVTVLEDEFTDTDLPGGRYWLWTSNGADIAVVSCQEGGVSDASPVIPSFPDPSSG